ncbi:hypothetical protein JCM3770_004854 [Rhodotorula araucariae]
MRARACLPRKSAVSTVTYADPHTSCSDSDGDEGAAGGGAAKRAGPSKRAKGKARAVDSDDADGGDEDEAPRKKARTGKKGGRKGRKKGEGKLEVLKTLPVELLVEIFSHLDPNDLLALSMVNKQYHALLTAKSSARLWKDARQRLDLPDVSACGLTEWQYAHLMFGKHCIECGASNVRRADFGVRRRMCKMCSNAMVIRLDWSKNTPPSIHPSAKDCLLQALHSPNDLRWLARAPFGIAADLQYYSDKLWELEYAGDDSFEDEEPEEPGPRPAITPHGRPNRAVRRNSPLIYKEVSSSDENPTLGVSRRVQAYVKSRQPLRDRFREESLAMREGALGLRQKLLERGTGGWSFDSWTKKMQRADDIMERVLGLEIGYTESDFIGAYNRDKLVAQEEALTDEDWERIKPAVLKLMVRLCKRREKADRLAELQDRQRALRPRYDKLKEALPATAQPFVPLFVDFLVLPSVRSLWEDESEVTDTMWYDQLDAVKDDVEQFRTDLVLHARELIRAATTDPDERVDDAEDDGAALGDTEGDLDAFFARATSFVCCAFRNCEKIRSYDARGRPKYHDSDGAVGPLAGVLAHQHESHNFATARKSGKDMRADAAPVMRVNLPLEIACAIGGVLEVLELDAETAGEAEIDGVQGVRVFEWENATTFRRHFYAWWPLLYHIKVQAGKTGRARPPLALEPPVIVAHCGGVYEWTPVRPRSDDDDDDDESRSPQSSAAEGKRRRSPSSDESRDAGAGSGVVKVEEA